MDPLQFEPYTTSTLTHRRVHLSTGLVSLPFEGTDQSESICAHSSLSSIRAVWHYYFYTPQQATAKRFFRRSPSQCVCFDRKSLPSQKRRASGRGCLTGAMCRKFHKFGQLYRNTVQRMESYLWIYTHRLGRSDNLSCRHTPLKH